MISRTQKEIFFRDRVTIRIRLQYIIHVGFEPLLRGGWVLDVLVHCRLNTEECDLAISLHAKRISSANVVPTPNCEIRSISQGCIYERVELRR